MDDSRAPCENFADEGDGCSSEGGGFGMFALDEEMWVNDVLMNVGADLAISSMHWHGLIRFQPGHTVTPG